MVLTILVFYAEIFKTVWFKTINWAASLMSVDSSTVVLELSIAVANITMEMVGELWWERGWDGDVLQHMHTVLDLGLGNLAAA